MGQLLKIAAVLAIGWKLFGDQVSGAIMNHIDYRFSALRQQNIRLDMRNGELYGLLRIEILFKQSFGLNLAGERLTLNLFQQGQPLGTVSVNEPVQLPNATTVPIPVDVVISAGSFLNRLQDILVNPNARWQAPIDIQGSLTLSNGIVVPVFTSLDFMDL